MGDQQGREAVARYRKGLLAKRFTPPLVELLAELRELALKWFTQVEAAGRVEPGDGPKLHEVDPDTGQTVVSRRRVSEQLSPRDRISPPCIQLVEAYVTMYLERSGTASDGLNRRINTLYEAARVHADQEKQRRRRAPEPPGLPGVSSAEIRERERRITALEADLEQARRHVSELEQARLQVAELGAIRDQQAGQIAVLAAEVNRLREQLVNQDTELQQLREQQHLHQHEIKDLNTKLLRALAEADRMQARIAELSGDLTGPDPRDFVRQGPPTDTQPARFGRARIGRRILFSRPRRRQHQLSMWLFACAFAVGLETGLGAIFGHTAVVIGICSVVGLAIGGFGHTEGDLLFRITDRGINLGVRNGSFRWDDITRLTLVTMPAKDTEELGPSGNVSSACPRCGKTGIRPAVALEVYGAAGTTIAQLNMAYVAAPDVVYCLACHLRRKDTNGGPEARRRVAPPVGLQFLDNGWDRFAELVTDAAPHIELTRHSLKNLSPRNSPSEPLRKRP
ncbi:hypothetical protein [Saccharopolyspora phatthalungensis]|uniref:Flagellar biosynthesis chaperone FliJ n=1 Tax=Saccharopolyspora phatthalungensis TaxID=664693 RepID=A0A840QDG5_9PSEU|nr:hypothetical protein [Saccharopolyspora phatthalungensis]MBB5156495.1 flagellar biosynthesis chaperone FliJ [Saccharopolyspora phatthalungensis]